MLFYMIIFLPLLSFFICALGNKILPVRLIEILACLCLLFAAGLSWYLFYNFADHFGTAYNSDLLEWLVIGNFKASWGIFIDKITLIMLLVVTTISALVHIYSVGYMSHDTSRPRFFAYLSLFTFAMLVLVTANNLLQLFFGWEGVGFVSYLLIGFWYNKASANSAAIKAFIVNRVGDAAFLLGIFGLFVIFKSINFADILTATKQAELYDANQLFTFFAWQVTGQSFLTIVCICLFIGAMGKSAQLFLHTWLPDAMEGPTPVSALLHAATMVTAGVFMVARLMPVFSLSPCALSLIIIIGACTALFAASIGLVQTDIKRIVAYSTCSQLGYMFAALGVGAASGGLLHLFTHAFFKALLFLGAGSVIHAIGGEQDIRKMGGLKAIIPFTYIAMIIGTISITGVGIPFTNIGTSGFVSKDYILELVYVSEQSYSLFAFWLLVIAAAFTSFYSWRLIFKTFHGQSKLSASQQEHAHESPLVMLIPLFILSIGALIIGAIFKNYFIYEVGSIDIAGAAIKHGSHFVELLAFAAMLVGLLLAYIMYIWRPNLPNVLSKKLGFIHKFLLNKWYFDELYQYIFVTPFTKLGNFITHCIDVNIDKWGPEAVVNNIKRLTAKAVRFQSGYLAHYAFIMLLGMVLLMSWMIIGNI